MDESIGSEMVFLQVIRRWGLLVILGGGVLAIDQWVKQQVVEKLAYGESWEPIQAIAGVVRITRSQNTGAAFGMFPFASDFFLALAIITIIAFVISYPRLPSHAWLSRVSVALISGGALSNAIDRILMGHVIDYVHVQITSTISNVSNFADHAITVGVILLLIDQWRAERREMAEQAATEQAADDGAAGEPEAGDAPTPPTESLAQPTESVQTSLDNSSGANLNA
jgi:signal peptidase II